MTPTRDALKLNHSITPSFDFRAAFPRTAAKAASTHYATYVMAPGFAASLVLVNHWLSSALHRDLS
jgi:hypothetical protein